jgi:hypothetical protein
MTPQSRIFHILRSEYRIIVLIAIIPFAIAAPELLHILNGDPVLALGDIAKTLIAGPISGYAYIDPNVGFTTQALGHLDALDLLRGIMPWWNPYSGIGLPLAGELQNAPFLPFTLLLAIPGGLGIVLEHTLLEAVAGIGTYLLLRCTGMRKLSALTGAILFMLNGTFAWFGTNPALTLAFIPWVLLGTELAFQRSQRMNPYGWQLLAVATALLLLGGFPETVYVTAVLAALWALTRLTQLPRKQIAKYLRNLALGGFLGGVTATFCLAPFLETLHLEYVGIHSGTLTAQAHLPRSSFIQGLIAPYVNGPIFGLRNVPVTIAHDWSNLGGYVTLLVLVVAVYGLIAKPTRLSIVLALFALFTIGRTYGVQPFTSLWNSLPEAGKVALYRYSNPAWEIALIVLATIGVDQLLQQQRINYRALVASLILPITLLVYYLATGGKALSIFINLPTVAPWAIASLSWAAISLLLFVVILTLLPAHIRAVALSTLLIIEAIAMFALPTFANPRSGTLDRGAITFLQSHTKLSRVFSLGPLQPNYSSYFGIQSIDYNYLPMSNNFANWISTHLATGFSSSTVTFNGSYQPPDARLTWPESLRAHLAAYKQLGVGYVLAPAGGNPFLGNIHINPDPGTQTVVDLQSAQQLHGDIPRSYLAMSATINAVRIMAAPTSSNRAGGQLLINLCAGGACTSGSTASTKPAANGYITIPLNRPLSVHGKSGAVFTIRYQNGVHPLALAAGTTPSGDGQALHLASHSVGTHGLFMMLNVSAQSTARLVYSDAHVQIYKLRQREDLFSTIGGGCQVSEKSLDTVVTRCIKPTTLVRRELVFPGWTATNEGRIVHIRPYQTIFQSVHLTAGTDRITFAYSPPHETIYELLSVGGLVIVVAGTVFEWERGKRSRVQR